MEIRLFGTLILLLGLLTCPVSAFELDTSVDDDIRKTYDSSKLEHERLPDLPSTLATPSQQVKSGTQQSLPPVSAYTTLTPVPKSDIKTDFSGGSAKISKQIPLGGDSYTEICIKKGTKFKVKSQTKVSDWNSAGAGMTFVSTVPVTKRYVSFPTGTVFKGIIEESNPPTYGGNGGSLKLKAKSVYIDGVPHPIDGKIVRANDKFVFFNNIKGKRGYAKGMSKQVKKGDAFYKKSRKLSSKLASNPVGIIVSPIPTIVGFVGYGANLIISPVTAIWSKGEHITLPAGTSYTIKLRQDSLIYK